MNILAWIVLGLIAGALAKAIYPGRLGGSILGTMILGIIGAFVGGTLYSFNYRLVSTYFRRLEYRRYCSGCFGCYSRSVHLLRSHPSCLLRNSRSFFLSTTNISPYPSRVGANGVMNIVLGLLGPPLKCSQEQVCVTSFLSLDKVILQE